MAGFLMTSTLHGSLCRNSSGSLVFNRVQLGQCCAFIIVPGEFIQFLHSRKDLWVTSSTIGTKYLDVLVYDGIHSYTPIELVTTILQTKVESIQLQIDQLQNMCSHLCSCTVLRKVLQQSYLMRARCVPI